MNRFLNDLSFHCTERMAPPNSPEYQKAAEKMLQLDEELQNHMGWDFSEQYHCVADNIQNFQMDEVFLQGVKFGVQFMLMVFPPYDSSNTSTP